MIKQIKNMTILAGLALTLAACGGNGQYKLEAVTECSFPDAPSDKAPIWVCGAPVEGLAVSGVGSTPSSKAGIQFMQMQGAANGRVFIAQELKTKITNEIKNYVDSKSLGTEETATSLASSVTSQLTEQNLVGAKIYRYVVSPKGTMYVLVGLDAASLANTLKQAVDAAKPDPAVVPNKDDMTKSIVQNIS